MGQETEQGTVDHIVKSIEWQDHIVKSIEWQFNWVSNVILSDILEHNDKSGEDMQSHCNAGVRRESIQNWRVLQWEVILML